MSINFKKASLQRTFEYALKALRKQGRRAGYYEGGSGPCRYLSASGARCAVGLMLTEEQLQNVPVNGGSVVGHNKAYFASIFGENKLKFLNDLQQVHDHSSARNFIEDLERMAQSFAEKYGLIYKAPGTTLRA